MKTRSPKVAIVTELNSPLSASRFSKTGFSQSRFCELEASRAAMCDLNQPAKTGRSRLPSNFTYFRHRVPNWVSGLRRADWHSNCFNRANNHQPVAQAHVSLDKACPCRSCKSRVSCYDTRKNDSFCPIFSVTIASPPPFDKIHHDSNAVFLALVTNTQLFLHLF